jgi:hypothetical protein
MVPTSRIPTFQEWKNEFENTFVAWLVKAWWWLWQVTGFCRNCWNSTSTNRHVEHSFPSTLVYFPSLFWMVFLPGHWVKLCWTLQDLKNFGELDWLCWSAFHGLFQSGVPVHGWLVYKSGAMQLKKTGQPDFKKDLGCFAEGNSKQVAMCDHPKNPVLTWWYQQWWVLVTHWWHKSVTQQGLVGSWGVDWLLLHSASGGWHGSTHGHTQRCLALNWMNDAFESWMRMCSGPSILGCKTNVNIVIGMWICMIHPIMMLVYGWRLMIHHSRDLLRDVGHYWNRLNGLGVVRHSVFGFRGLAVQSIAAYVERPAPGAGDGHKQPASCWLQHFIQLSIW